MLKRLGPSGSVDRTVLSVCVCVQNVFSNMDKLCTLYIVCSCGYHCQYNTQFTNAKIENRHNNGKPTVNFETEHVKAGVILSSSSARSKHYLRNINIYLYLHVTYRYLKDRRIKASSNLYLSSQ